ncbi:MAG: sigma-70 family RNA polymerase sigma factor [Bacteroidales bacterium]|nr:sigma-70 family RNA polymerase sigma factor [Bacteroidales bacterium]
MDTLQTYTDDLLVAQAILKRDGRVTREFLYVRCYPLFKSVYDNYFTDCCSVREFIDEIYMLILTPSRETGYCQLQNFRGESSLASWLKSACLFHCYHRYRRRERIPIVEVHSHDEENDDFGDRFLDNLYSTTMDSASIEHSDLEAVIATMPNERYRTLIRLRYLDNLSNEETAEAMGMSMANYYNKHKLAKEQFLVALRKEERR